MSATTFRKEKPQELSAPVEKKTFLDLSEIDDEVWEEAEKLRREYPHLTPKERLRKMFED